MYTCHVYAFIHVHVYACIHVHVYACIHVHVYACIHVHVCVHNYVMLMTVHFSPWFDICTVWFVTLKS